jgi:hypothetical protein
MKSGRGSGEIPTRNIVESATLVAAIEMKRLL